MNIKIVCIGKLKEKYWRDAEAEYVKRLGSYCRIEIAELKEARLAENASRADELAVIEEEGQSILKKIGKGEYVISLEIKGEALTSEALSEKISGLGVSGVSDVTFVIGGSLGLSPEVSKRADFRLSFSKMTFPHQMMRVILLEQIYRAFKIARGETYHK